MRKTIKNWFWAWDFDKEEKWLNEMAAKGLSLVSIGFCSYTFEETDHGEYDVRLELLENMPTHIESQQYIKFVEETGAEYLGSILRWVYFRKKKCGEEFNLYSDISSRIKHLNRILSLIGIGAGANLYIGINNMFVLGSLHGDVNWVASINLFIGLLLAFGFLKVLKKKIKLKKEKQLFE